MKIVISFLFLFFAYQVSAQQDTLANRKLVVVQISSGKEFVGHILEDDGREILLETEALGKIYIRKSEINKITMVEDEKHLVNGEYNTEGPFTTRYSFTTNALPIKKGENYAIVNLYGPEVHFAVSDNFNIGVMSTWIASPFVLAMKYSMKTSHEKINLSAGLLAGSSGYLNGFRGYGGLAFGNITIGDRRRNITIAGGFLRVDPNVSRKERLIREGTYETNLPYLYSYQYYDSNQMHIDLKTNIWSSPMFSIGGYHKVGAKASFVFDSMLGFISNNLQENITSTELVAPVGNDWEANYVPGLYRHEVEHTKGDKQVMFFLMPGMRFQKTEKSAFQVNLAGVTIVDNGDVISFPVPSLAWYFKF
jgi:hypothetical protein